MRCFSISTTLTPSWAAAAATDRPPEPAPITHRSARSSWVAEPAEVAGRLSPLPELRPTALPPASARIRPTALFIWLRHGCCLHLL